MTKEEFSNINEEDIHSGKYVFRDVFEVGRYLQSIGWSVFWYAPPQFVAMDFGENKMINVPMPGNPLYRGQNEYYEPCLPSLYRRPWNIAEKLERFVQVEDFKTILNQNPEVQDMLDAGLTVNYDGLAQHYGIETNIMDLTNSFGVAAFFATSRYDSLSDRYLPIMDIIHKGVIYFYPLGMYGFTDKNTEKVSPIGLDVLPRPGEQRGFGMNMEKDEDFNHTCPIRFFFWHNPKASLECFRRFNGGATLFPYDPMTEKIRTMRKYRIYRRDAVYTVINNMDEFQGMSAEEAEKLLIDKGCFIVNKTPFSYNKTELEYITDRYHKMYSGSFANG